MRELWRSTKRLLRRLGVAALGVWIILAICLVAVFARYVSPSDPYSINARVSLVPPDEEHPFGTDRLGRDVASRIAYGARTSLWVGFVSVGLALAFGVPLGVIAGYQGGTVDSIVMRAMDILFAFPPVLLAIVIAAALGPGLTNTMIAIGVVYAPRFARITRAPVLAIREIEYVDAAISIGSSHLRILIRHVLPNIMGIIIVQASLNLSTAILAEASLSYLGLGAQPPEPSWGGMLNEGRVVLELAPWLSIAPGVAIVIAVLGFNLLGDGLRDVFDPTLRRA